MDSLLAAIQNPQLLLRVFVALAVMATIVTLALPYIEGDSLGDRMKSVALERERIRMKGRGDLTESAKHAKLTSTDLMMKDIVDKYNLAERLDPKSYKTRLLMAGFRDQKYETAFVFYTFVLAAAGLFVGFLYLVVFQLIVLPFFLQVGLTLALGFVGFKLPSIYLSNLINKRQESMKRAYPDALDLLLICVESGMAIEPALIKVSEEIGTSSQELAEEFSLTTAELSYLPSRKTAYENLAVRTGLDGVKQIVMVLTQAEKYGTPLGQALRVVGQESRDTRMMEAEKKAASLPPKLTVPMMVFFLPVLFIVILAPAGIGTSSMQ